MQVATALEGLDAGSKTAEAGGHHEVLGGDDRVVGHEVQVEVGRLAGGRSRVDDHRQVFPAARGRSQLAGYAEERVSVLGQLGFHPERCRAGEGPADAAAEVERQGPIEVRLSVWHA